jgi:flagellin
MPAVLNTNTASLYAAKSLESAQSKMATSVERLSSGLRVNRARDDAAGLGISNSLTSQINSANQGIRNLNDGISIVQTAEGAIAAAQEMVQRILTLATQGSNGTMGTSERTALKSEMTQLLTAIDAIGNRTKFSGIGLLNTDARATATTKFSLQASHQTNDVVALASNAFTNIGGFTGATVSTTGGGDQAATSATTFKLVAGTNPTQTLVGTVVYKAGTAGTTTPVLLGTVASISGDTVTLTGNSGATTEASEVILFSGQLTQIHSTTSGDVSLSQSVRNTANTTANFQMVQRAADSYLTALTTQRSLLGAYQGQIEYTVSNVTALSSNLSAARSNVVDTDYASETAALTKGQILQQAATAMLAQANQMPNVILSLLK